MSRFWLVAAVVSIAAHVGAATFIKQHEVGKPRITRPPIEMEIAEVKKRPPPPVIKELPPPPPPPKKPIVVKKIAPKIVPPAVEPPPPAAPKIGIDPENSANGSTVALAAGVSLDGEVGTGNTMDKNVPPPPDPVPPTPAPAKGKRFIPSYQVTRQPIAKHPVQPEIPAAFRDAQREALVVVELEIDETGHVHSARVLRHADFGLDDAALAAAKATEFEPALMGTQPVAVRYQIPYRFKVRG